MTKKDTHTLQQLMEPFDTVLSSILSVPVKHSFDAYKRTTINLVTDFKNLVTSLKVVTNNIKAINSQLHSFYADSPSIIQNEVLQFTKQNDDFGFKSLAFLENEVVCLDAHLKDLTKRFAKMNNEETMAFNEQRFDWIDSCVVVYMQLLVELLSEKGTNFKHLMVFAVQDGISIPKSLTVLSSLKTIMDSRVGCHYLSKYLTQFGMEKQVEFYRDVTVFSTTKNTTTLDILGKEIFEKFIQEESIDQVVISKETQAQIIERYKEPYPQNLYEAAQEDVLDKLLSLGVFEQFQASVDFKKLIRRLTPIKVRSEKSPRNLSAQITYCNVVCEVETYSVVAKYLIPYNLVIFTEIFVKKGFTSPQLMAMATVKDFEEVKLSDVDKKRLDQFFKIVKDGKIQSADIFTKETIVCIKPIQDNFIKYLSETTECLKNTLDFLKYLKETKQEQMAVAQLWSRAEMAFLELKAKHHVAYRMLKKCNTIEEMKVTIPQCQSGLVSLLTDQYLDSYNASFYWKTPLRKTPRETPRQRAEREKSSKTPELFSRRVCSPTRRSITPQNDELAVIPSPRIDDDCNRSSGCSPNIGLGNNLEIFDEKSLVKNHEKKKEKEEKCCQKDKAKRSSFNHRYKQDEISEATDYRITQTQNSIQRIILPKISLLLQELEKINTKEDLEMFQHENIKIEKTLKEFETENSSPQKVKSQGQNDNLKEIVLAEINKYKQFYT
ncbi:regulator of G protein signaling domain containing protein, partial [Entamoeba invadens IP1]